MATITVEHIPISHRALVARINRHCSKTGNSLKRIRAHSRDAHSLGAYCVIDTRRNLIVAKDIDLERFGRQLGVLRPFEALAHDG